MNISIVIASKNRPEMLAACVKSLQAGFDKNLEIILCIQDGKSRPVLTKQYFTKNQLSSVDIGFSGKAQALNLGLQKARGNIILFTDDDCLVDKKWISQAIRAFQKNPEISAIFGKTLPYHRDISAKKICPSCFNPGDEIYIITKPVKHWEKIGFGNNMAFRRQVFDEISGFKPWLGPGSIGSNAEDAEVAIRCLIKGYKLMYNPDMIVYHNKWLNDREMKQQQLSYLCGEAACYGYFAFQKYQFAEQVIKDDFKNLLFKYKINLKSLIKFQINKDMSNNLIYLFKETWYFIRGLLVGFIYSLIDPVNRRS